MSFTEGFLIAVIVILVFCGSSGKWISRACGYSSSCTDCSSAESQAAPPTNSTTGSQHSMSCRCPKCLEEHITVENAEYFTPDAASAHANADHSQMCGDDDRFNFAVNDFGAPGIDFKDWVTAQAVDAQVIKNHSDFTKDRSAGGTQNMTGRTYAPRAEIETEQTDWIGLRRPEAVPIGNPTQVADINYNKFAKSPTFTWRSS